MAKSTPTEYAFFVRHEKEGRDLNRPFHVIGRQITEDDQGKSKEEKLFNVLVNQIPSSFVVKKDKLPPIAANEEIVFTAYVTNDNSYVCMVCKDRQRLKQNTECLTLKVSDCDEHTPEWMRQK